MGRSMILIVHSDDDPEKTTYFWHTGIIETINEVMENE